MPRHEQDLVSRFGREPLGIALEHIDRWPKRASASDETKPRAWAMIATALKAQSMDGVECVWTRLTCGYFKRADGLAIIPIWGDLGPMRYFWPWVWYEDLAGVADDASKDGDVKAILFHFDSPGGYVTGGAECAAALEAVAARKPCAAFANDYATSMAYWLATATGRLSAPTTGIVGSIGALCIHAEFSRALDDAGVTAQVIRSKPRKAETNPLEPLTAAALAQLQREIALCDAPFNAHVARLRGIDEVSVQATQGACITADAAVAGKFADAVETFDQACAALLARAAAPVIAPASPPAPAARAATKQNPARGNAAQPRRSSARATGSTTPTRPRATAKPRSQTMDPTTLPPEEQIKRYDEIAAIIAEEPADDNAKIGQFVQICGIVNREEGEAEPAETEEETTEEEAAPAAAARGKAKANPHAAAIAASKEGKANPAGALAAIEAGLSLAQFKAMAPNLGKRTNLATRMGEEESARRLGGDGGGEQPARGATVTQLNPQGIYDRRAKQASGKK